MATSCKTGSRVAVRPLSEEALEMIARRFALLGEPMRLRLLHALFDGEKSVTALVEASGGTQAMAEAGLLGRRKQGLQVFYSIADPTLFQLCELVCGSLEEKLARDAKAFARAG
jgi:DNA-binding transcriptional ArsR family regulator